MNDVMNMVNDFLAVATGQAEKKQIRDVIHWGNGEHYLIDTADIIDGYETMVFACDAEGNVDDWSDLDCERYGTWEDAQKGHELMVDVWKRKGEQNMKGNAVRAVVTLDKDDPRYSAFVSEVESASDDDLVIVARSERNRKDGNIEPVGIKNGIYFYVAYDLGDKLAFKNGFTPEQIEKARENTVKKAIVGDMMEVLMEGGEPLQDWVYADTLMIVATTKSRMNGAGLLFCEDFFRILKGKIGDFTILPSSIHEIIIVPNDSDTNMDDLTHLVRAVNATQVSDEEYLGDRAFRIHEFLD